MKVRNLEEQVLKNAQDIETLKSGIKIEFYCSDFAQLQSITTEENVGKYALVKSLQSKRLYLIVRSVNGTIGALDLGVFPAVVKGAAGEKGETGATGKDGTGIYGCTATLPPVDSYKEGDFYILYNGDVYKKISNHWIRQTNIKGAQGPVGLNGTVVIPNPVEEYTDTLTKVSIDGTVYKFSIGLDDIYNYLVGTENIVVDYNEDETAIRIDLDQDVKEKIDNAVEKTDQAYRVYATDFDGEQVNLIWSQSDTTSAGILVARTSYGNILVPLNPITLNSATSKQYVDSHIALEYIKDNNGSNRFLEGNGSAVLIPEGVTVTFCKWSLNANHLSINIRLSVLANTSVATDGIRFDFSVPNWVWSAIPAKPEGYVKAGNGSIERYGYAVDTTMSWYVHLYNEEGSFYLRNLAFTFPAWDGYIDIDVDIPIY